MATPRRLRILLADDYDPMRELLSLVLKAEHDVIGTASDGNELLQQALLQSPDVILIDISMPGLGGFAAARVLRGGMPEVPLIFVTHHTERHYLEEAIRIGVRGYVLKTRLVQDLRIAIRSVYEGETFFSAGFPLFCA